MNSSKGFNCVGALSDGSAVEQAIVHLEPAVVLMDIDMPKVNGTTAVRNVRAKNPDIPIIMLTAFEEDDKVFDSICAGANGYLLKNVEPETLLSSIQEVNAGGAPMTPSIARKVLSMFKLRNEQQEQAADVDLSAREKDVLKLLVDGLSYKMISAELGISYETVHSHIKKIYKKLQVSSATEAVARSLRDGLV